MIPALEIVDLRLEWGRTDSSIVACEREAARYDMACKKSRGARSNDHETGHYQAIRRSRAFLLRGRSGRIGGNRLCR